MVDKIGAADDGGERIAEAVLPEAGRSMDATEATAYVLDGYTAALDDSVNIAARDALRALRFFVWPCLAAQEPVVGGKLRKTNNVHIGNWARIVQLRINGGGQKMIQYLGIDLDALAALEQEAIDKRTAMSHCGGGGYRVLDDGVGRRPDSALGAIEATNRWGREIDSGDVCLSVADMADEALRGGLGRRLYGR